MIYLDYNATAPVRPEAAAAVAESLAEAGNASSVHACGRAARRRIEEAREAVASLVNARPEEVIFTSGGTEANNLALAAEGPRRILVSAGEHPSVLEAVPEAETVPLTADGLVDLAMLEQLLVTGERAALVSVMAANNETGVIQPISAVAAVARPYDARVHCDAVQALGKIEVDFRALGVDTMSLSAHKIGGPQGIGALIVRDGIPLAPQQRGGGQERSRRAGTENQPGIAGFGAAARAAATDLARMRDLAALRDSLEERVRQLAPAVTIFGRDAPRLPNTSCFALAGLSAETQVMALDLQGVAIGAGAACSSGKVRPSHVLKAMGASAAAAAAAIRVSLGWASKREDVSAFLEAWSTLAARSYAA